MNGSDGTIGGWEGGNVVDVVDVVDVDDVVDAEGTVDEVEDVDEDTVEDVVVVVKASSIVILHPERFRRRAKAIKK